MAKVLVLYYSSYGHIERMAQVEAQGARSAGAEVHMKRVPELVPHKVALAANYKVEQVAPVAQIEDLVNYDGIIFGTPTRFGNMAAQMKNFIDQAGGLWAKDRLSERSAPCSPRPRASTAARKRRSSRSISSFCISASSSSACPIRSKDSSDQGGARRHPLWRDDDRGRGWRAHALGARDRSGALPRTACRRDRGGLPPCALVRFRACLPQAPLPRLRSEGRLGPMQLALARTVAARPLTAFKTVADIVEWPQIIRSIKSVELLTPGRIRAGTRLREQRIMFGHETIEE